MYSFSTTTITGGSISRKNNGIRIYSGTTSLGINDSSVSINNPFIQTTGSIGVGVFVSSGAKLNFFDGIIESFGGTGKAISGNGTVVKIDSNQIHNEANDGVEITYLTS